MLGSCQMRAVMSHSNSDPDLTDSTVINMNNSVPAVWQLPYVLIRESADLAVRQGLPGNNHQPNKVKSGVCDISLMCDQHRTRLSVLRRDVAARRWEREGRRSGSRWPASTLSVAVLTFPAPGGVSEEEHVCGWSPGRFRVWVRPAGGEELSRS